MKVLFATLLALSFFQIDTQKLNNQVIFSSTDDVFISDDIVNLERFTPTPAEVKIADSLTQLFLGKEKGITSFSKLLDYNKYYHQYVGYLDYWDERIIFINNFCLEEENEYWLKEIVSYRGGGSCYFTIKINLTTHEAFELYINAPK